MSSKKIFSFLTILLLGFILVSCTGDKTSSYEITWKNHDGTVLKTEEVDEGLTPSYSGTTPTKASDSSYDYEFDGWTPNITKVTKNQTYTAKFKSVSKQTTETKYTITWKNHNGTVLKTDQVNKGSTPSYTGSTPTKASDNTYDYEFDGWTPNIVSATKNQTYTAKFKSVPKQTTETKYTITWKNHDGTVLKTDQVNKGSTPSYTGSTPTKASDNTYDYEFDGWTPNIVSATKNQTYTAKFRSIQKEVNYTITWKNHNGTVLKTDQVNKGSTPNYTGATPTKASDSTYDYEFDGWTPSVVAATKNQTYTAKFKSVQKAPQGTTHTVVWQNHNGSVLKTEQVKEGLIPSYSGSTPTRASTQYYNYEFVGWNRQATKVTEKQVYTAEYKIIAKTTSLPFSWYVYMNHVLIDGMINTNLTELEIPDVIDGKQVYGIEQFAFIEATNLKKLYIPKSVEYIEYGALYGLNKLEELTLPFVGQERDIDSDSTAAWFGYVFGFVNTGKDYVELSFTPSSLKKVTITDDDTIGLYAFSEDAVKIETLILQKVRVIDRGAFSKVESLKTIEIYPGLETIRGYAFTGATGLKNIVLPEGLMEIESDAFYDVENLETIIIPSSVTSIGTYAFDYSFNLTIFSHAEEAGEGWEIWWNALEFGLTGKAVDVFYKDEWEFDNNYKPIPDLSLMFEITWKNYDGSILDVKTIKKGDMPRYWGPRPTKPSTNDFEYEFSGWTPTMVEVTKNQTYTAVFDSIEIEEVSFEYVIGTNDEIEITGFNNDTVTKITIPTYIENKPVTKIASNAFKNATNLKEIIIPDSVKTIELGAFTGVSNLEKITMPFVGRNKSPFLPPEYEYHLGYIFGAESYSNSYSADVFYIPNSLNEVILTDTLIVGRQAFDKANSVEYITLPDTVQIISDYAFYRAGGLKEITIPSSVTSIGQFAFASTLSLEKIVFEENSSLTKISAGAFMEIPLLETIVIPATVTSLGDFAFEDSTNLSVFTNVYSKPRGWASQWNSSNRTIYWKGQWDYDNNGVPTPN